jgi:hypothetical protein
VKVSHVWRCARGVFFSRNAEIDQSLLLESLERDAAGGRDFAFVDHQTMCDALAVRDELPAECLCIEHASVLILLRVGTGGERGEHQAKQRKHENLHIVSLSN